jgi:hypothetical protein
METKELKKLKFFVKNDHDNDGIFGLLFQSVFLAIIFGLFVMLLWNALLPDLFNFPDINYLQSVGLIVLARLIFGSIALQHHHKHSKISGKPIGKLIGLEKIDEINDWKYYDTYWDEEGKQHFEEYKRKKNENNSGKDKKE